MTHVAHEGHYKERSSSSEHRSFSVTHWLHNEESFDYWFSTLNRAQMSPKWENFGKLGCHAEWDGEMHPMQTNTLQTKTLRHLLILLFSLPTALVSTISTFQLGFFRTCFQKNLFTPNAQWPKAKRVTRKSKTRRILWEEVENNNLDSIKSGYGFWFNSIWTMLLV